MYLSQSSSWSIGNGCFALITVFRVLHIAIQYTQYFFLNIIIAANQPWGQHYFDHSSIGQNNVGPMLAIRLLFVVANVLPTLGQRISIGQNNVGPTSPANVGPTLAIHWFSGVANVLPTLDQRISKGQNNIGPTLPANVGPTLAANVGPTLPANVGPTLAIRWQYVGFQVWPTYCQRWANVF